MSVLDLQCDMDSLFAVFPVSREREDLEQGPPSFSPSLFLLVFLTCFSSSSCLCSMMTVVAEQT